MNKQILQRAIKQVKNLFPMNSEICNLCHKNKVEIDRATQIEIIGMETEIGLAVCRSCFDNILIAVGEISQEY